MNNIPRTVAVGGVYRHYKGPLYLVLGVGKDSNNDRNGEAMVVYISLSEPHAGAFRTRHLKEFIDQVQVDGQTVNRFEFLYLAGRI